MVVVCGNTLSDKQVTTSVRVSIHDDEAMARKSHRRLLSLPHLLISFNLFELCAVGGEGHLYHTLYLHHVHIRVEGHHRPTLSCILGNDEIESQLKRDRLLMKKKRSRCCCWELESLARFVAGARTLTVVD